MFSSNNAAVFAFLREKEADRVFVALNLTAQPQTVTLSGTFWSGAYADVFTGAAITLGTGATVTLPPWGFTVLEARPATATGSDDAVPAAPVLGPSRPNPFRAATTFTYTLGAPADVVLTVTDVLGREVRRLVSGPAPAGTHEVVFDGAGLPGGLYLLRLDAAGRTTTRRVTLLR